MQNAEEIREALIALQHENDRLRTETKHATHLLSALEALLCIDLEGDPFACVFASMRNIFTFEQAMVLSEKSPGQLLCIAAEPKDLIGVSWRAHAFFEKVMNGKVTATFNNSDIPEWKASPAPSLSAELPSLYLPINVRSERGILALFRNAAAAGFDRKDVSLAQQFSLLASHALAALFDRQKIRTSEARALAAEESARAKNLFIANMSHELRTPLNAIIGFSEIITAQTPARISDGLLTDYARHINSSGKHLLAIVNDLLMFSKIEAGQHTVCLEAVPLAEELSYALTMFKIESAARGITVAATGIPNFLAVRADRQSLRQILLNVISNALKFSPDGSVVTVALDGNSPGGTAILRVSDQGCGIPPKVLSQLGNPFVQAEGVFARQYQGTGLGLAICFGLAEAMDAAITVESAVGRGTTVSIRLPAASIGAVSAA